MKYGFVKPEIAPDQYILGAVGALPDTILQPDGQWDSYLPIYEPQFENFETWGCTCWGTLNAIEILLKRIEGVEYNYAERFPYNIVGIREPGSDPHTVCEVTRKNGLVPNNVLPMTSTYEEFTQPDPMTDKYLSIGRHWLSKYDFKHSWVFKGDVSKQEKTNRMMRELTLSALCVSVTAWNKNGDNYVDNGLPNNHWCVCYGWTGQGWKIFDSYDHSTKIYSFDSEISFCKRFSITKREKARSFIDFIKDICFSLIKYLNF